MEFDEEFKDCPFNKFVQVSKDGRVRDKDGNILKPFEDEKGYLCVKDPSGKFKPERVHKFVASTWLSEDRKKLENEKNEKVVIHHIDFNRLNNRMDNLEWMTESRHLQRHGMLESDVNGNIIENS